MNFINS